MEAKEGKSSSGGNPPLPTPSPTFGSSRSQTVNDNSPEDGFEMMDTDGAGSKKPEYVPPFRFFRELITSYDTDQRYFDTAPRNSLSNIYLEFVRQALNGTFQTKVLPKLSELEQADFSISIAWIIRNIDHVGFREFVCGLEPTQRQFFLNVIQFVSQTFQVDHITEVLKTLRESGQTSSLPDESEEGEERTQVSTHKPIGRKVGNNLLTIIYTHSKNPRLSVSGKPAVPMAMPSNPTPDVQKLLKPEHFDFLLALDLHHTVGRSLAAAIGEYAMIVTHNHLLGEQPVQPSQCFLDEVLTLSKLPDMYLKQEKYQHADGAPRWRFTLATCDQLRDEYREWSSDPSGEEDEQNPSTSHSKFLESLKYTWQTLLSLLDGDQSKELQIDIFSLMSYLLKIGGTSLMEQNKNILNTVVERVLGCWTTLLSVVHNRAVAMLYKLIKMNLMLMDNIDRITSIFIFYLSKETDKIENEAERIDDERIENISNILLSFINDISDLSQQDPDTNEELQKKVADLTAQMNQICNTCFAIVKLGDDDVELKVDLLSSLADSYRDQPHILVLKLGSLCQYLEAVKYPDETAMVQVEKAAVILDVLTGLWRAHPEMTTHVTYPQYLPVRSDSVRVDEEGNLCLLKLDNSHQLYGFDSGYKRRYGASWICWDRMIKEVMPYFEPYSDDDLIRFTGHTDIHDSIISSEDFNLHGCEKALDQASEKFILAQHFEFAIITDTLLLSLYQAENDRKNQVKVHKRLADSSLQKLVDITDIKGRIKTFWYRIGLWGDDFKASNEEGEYVIKEYNFTKLGDLKFKLMEQYKKRFGKDPIIVTSNTMPELSAEQRRTPHVHMMAVDPLFEGADESNRREDFFKKVSLSTFYIESTFITGTVERKKEPGLQQLNLRRTTFTTKHPLPYRTRRVRVESAVTREFSPAEKSALDITSKLLQLDLMMNPLNEGQVRMLLKGMIAPEVNAGPISIYRCFLKDFKAETPEKDQQLIRDTFKKFFADIRDCFQRLKDSPIPIDFRLPLIRAYNELLVEVEPELGKLPHLLQNIDY